MSNPYNSATERASVLGPTLYFKGDLSAEEDLLIQGRVEGSIYAYPAPDRGRAGYRKGEYPRSTHHRRGHGRGRSAGGKIRFREGNREGLRQHLRPLRQHQRGRKFQRQHRHGRQEVRPDASASTRSRPVAHGQKHPAARRNNGLVQEIGRWRQRNDQCQFKRPAERARTLNGPPRAPRAARAAHRAAHGAADVASRPAEPRARSRAHRKCVSPESAPRASVLGPDAAIPRRAVRARGLDHPGQRRGIDHPHAKPHRRHRRDHEGRHSCARHRHRRQSRG